MIMSKLTFGEQKKSFFKIILNHKIHDLIIEYNLPRYK